MGTKELAPVNIMSVRNPRRYLELIQTTRRNYSNPSQRLMVIKSELARLVHSGDLSEEHRAIVMTFFRELEAK